MRVSKVVVPAAGLGTRFLPATKSQPKEMIPVVDKPGIQYVVEEAVRAGLTDVLIVTGAGKASIEDHFARSAELESHLEATGKAEELEAVRSVAALADVHFVLQTEPLGFGHAVLMAKEYVGGQPFAVMVPDEIVPEPAAGEQDLMPNLVDLYERHDASVIAVQRVAREDISAYGVITPEALEDESNAVRVLDMVEKPSVQEAPSDLASRGRYLFSAALFNAIERTEPGVGGEIQLTDAIRLLAKEQSVLAYIHEGPIYDVGKKLDFLKATIELALRRDDLAKPLAEYLDELGRRER